jgi:predicted ATPase
VPGPDPARGQRATRGIDHSQARAIDTARSQQANSLELRAATSLVRLGTDHGRRFRARDLISPVCSWFTEAFHKADLKEAGALLDELG